MSRSLEEPEAARYRRCRRHVFRINVRPKVVSADACLGLNRQDVLGRQMLLPIKPSPYGSLRNAKKTTHSRLRAYRIDCSAESLSG